MDLLRLTALDADDLATLSAHLQDAVVRPADVAYLPQQKRLAFVAGRFNWDAAPDRLERRRSGVRLDRVMRVARRNFDASANEEAYALLAVLFHPGSDPPSGEIELVFSGGAALRLEVECIEVTLEDLGPAWETRRMPSHSGG